MSRVIGNINKYSAITPSCGTLVLIGGGNYMNMLRTVVQLAGGKEDIKICIICTAMEPRHVGAAFMMMKDSFESIGVKMDNIVSLHAADPSETLVEGFCDDIDSATLVWLDGGRQWRLSDSYLNTPVISALHRLLGRNGVIAGTSAGASWIASYLARGDSESNVPIVGDHIIGSGLVKNIAVDQHLLRRNRQFQMLEIVNKNPTLLGIGLDEATGLVIQNGRGIVIGSSYVVFYASQQYLKEMQQSPWHEVGGPFIFLNPGSVIDLQHRVILQKR